MITGQASNRTGKNTNSSRVYDIPVLLQVRGDTEDDAAATVAYALEHASLVGSDNDIESWFLPNHKHVDHNDIPVYVEVHVDETAMAERRAIVGEIAEIVGLRTEDYS